MTTQKITTTTEGVNFYKWTLNETLDHAPKMFWLGFVLGVGVLVMFRMAYTGELPDLPAMIFAAAIGLVVGCAIEIIYRFRVTELNYQIFHHETVEEVEVEPEMNVEPARIPTGTMMLTIPQPHHHAFASWATAVLSTRVEFSEQQAKERKFDFDVTIAELQRGGIVTRQMDARRVHTVTDFGGRVLDDWLRMAAPPTP